MNSKFYITTSIPYLNSKAHIGHVLEFIQADVIARYQRLTGSDVFFLTGTDEHGSKIVRAAEAVNKEPQQFVDEIAKNFKLTLASFNISNNDFIRTSDRQRHWPAVQKIWKKLDESGDLYRAKYKGLYCVGHEAFMKPSELVDGTCPLHKQKPEVIEEENWFFRLSKYSKEIEERIKNDELRIVPETRKNEILSLLKEGLEDVSFSRPSKDLKWGIPVPDDEAQTIYVWADALTNYMDNTWPADAHLIGKDILRFHAAIWPGMLLSACFELPKSILVHGFITVGGEKMSKTVGNIIDPVELVKKYGTDPVRYYMLSEIPSHEDGDFSIEKFEARYNGNLANGLGNYAARVLALAHNANSANLYANTANEEIKQRIEETQKIVDAKIKDFKLHEALAAIWELISFGDKYINENKPWAKSLSANSKSQIVGNTLYILENVAKLLKPFLPETAEKILGAIQHSGENIEVNKLPPLFPRL